MVIIMLKQQINEKFSEYIQRADIAYDNNDKEEMITLIDIF